MAEMTEPKDKLVLLIEDDGEMLDMLAAWIKNEGFQVETSASGPDGLKKADGMKTPDLIILDYMLPGTSGYEVAKELQAGDARNVPVIIVTGRRLDRQGLEMLKREHNVKEVMEKPVKPAVLASNIHRILGTQPPSISRKVDRGPMSSGW